MHRMRPVFQSGIIPDDLRSRLFQATVETVLLYNANTWTITKQLERELDASHSHLLRAAFNIHWPQQVNNDVLYNRARLTPPSELLKTSRLQLAGHLIRSEDYCPQPIHRVLTWRPREPLRRGQGRRLSYLDILLRDVRAPDERNSVQYLRGQALARVI